ncbi:hypothetical protein PN294_05745 [Romboutsia sp. 1001216sp1]|nr:hypothetical protein [Romboutsia sp. 1001216sp1]MDB8813093.1 hypothetical protein [Romboutsia sp. 1001216sp1]
MNKKVTIFSIILIVIGIVGTIYFSISSVPYFTQTISNIEKSLDKEQVIYNKNISIENLDVKTKVSNIIIEKYEGHEVRVVKKGISNYNIKEDGNKLSIVENEKEYNYKISNNLEEFIENVINAFYYNNSQSLIIYVPNNINVNASTDHARLSIENNLLLDSVYYKTINGYISLPKGMKTLKNLDIKSNGHIYLSTEELIGIDNVNIESGGIEIYSAQNEIFVDDIEKFIPKTINITQNSNSSSNINIDTNIPVAKELNINAYNSSVYINIPSKNYNFSVDMKSISGINVSNMLIDEHYRNDENLKELKGTLNKENLNNEEKYIINVKANNINLH